MIHLIKTTIQALLGFQSSYSMALIYHLMDLDELKVGIQHPLAEGNC